MLLRDKLNIELQRAQFECQKRQNFYFFTFSSLFAILVLLMDYWVQKTDIFHPDDTSRMIWMGILIYFFFLYLLWFIFKAWLEDAEKKVYDKLDELERTE